MDQPYPHFDRSTMEWVWPDGSRISALVLIQNPEPYQALASRLTFYNILRSASPQTKDETR